GKKPKIKASGLFGSRRYVESWKSEEFDQIKETALRHIETGELSRQPAPEEFVVWASNIGYTVPTQLLEIIFQKSVESNPVLELEKQKDNQIINSSSNIRECTDDFISFEQLQGRWGKKGIKGLLPEQALNHANKGYFGV